ncbi:hypothetical protein COCNU_05G004350 [Cocos nucifera]|uniref:Uncharacterized protein n=1 Tax=Cocos nucifera TaxID=13894 RepID=A0A8K0N1X8_COCNU|nr:hypothetical protein COCNU_05G004350 [Cocos nucifera]
MTSPAQARPELFKLATEEALIEGRKEVLLPKDFVTMPPSTPLELEFSQRLRKSRQGQKDYGLPQTCTIEASNVPTITIMATTLRNTFSFETKLRSSSERSG